MPKKVTSKKATNPKSTKAKTPTVTLKETLRQLQSLGGVKRGDLRVLANRIKTNHELALSLWDTGNVDAHFLATLVIDVRPADGGRPRSLPGDDRSLLRHADAGADGGRGP